MISCAHRERTAGQKAKRAAPAKPGGLEAKEARKALKQQWQARLTPLTHLPEDHPHRENVCLLSELLVPQDFRSHPIRCARTAVDCLHKGVLLDTRQPEIADLHREILVDQQVWRLEIAVHDGGPVYRYVPQ